MKNDSITNIFPVQYDAKQYQRARNMKMRKRDYFGVVFGVCCFVVLLASAIKAAPYIDYQIQVLEMEYTR